ncbi:leukocyte-associated immunoglobulin-like receptor 2 isoform X4 [Delphinapterus leucas]|nr:leukocyte-associated immunoglobulin-like receptor 2 isoform X4 [Delphinapterus leucas]
MDAETLLLPIPGTLPSRSTRAEPDSVSPQGWPVTIVCRGPAGAEEFRLERKEDRSDFKDEKTVFQIGPNQTEARFGITAVNGDTAQHYQCLYRKGDHWSEPSEPLEQVVTVSPQDVLESAPIGDTLTPSAPSWGTDPTVLLRGHRSSRTQDTRLNMLPNGTTWRSANLINTEEIFSSHRVCTRHPPAVGLMYV